MKHKKYMEYVENSSYREGFNDAVNFFLGEIEKIRQKKDKVYVVTQDISSTLRNMEIMDVIDDVSSELITKVLDLIDDLNFEIKDGE